jgi:hypothetical protein
MKTPPKPDKKKPLVTSKPTAKMAARAPGGKGDTAGEKIQEEVMNRQATADPRSPTALDATTLS